LTHGNATLQQEGADLIDDASTHAVERLQIELLGALCRHELHGRALHRTTWRLRNGSGSWH
jgi:hypothetical protein